MKQNFQYNSFMIDFALTSEGCSKKSHPLQRNSKGREVTEATLKKTSVSGPADGQNCG